MSKLWSKGLDINKQVEVFTIGKDREMDMRLAKYDVIGSLAHIKMLYSIDLLTEDEFLTLESNLNTILVDIESNNFTIEEDMEDIHSQVEALLIRKIGDIGKKIHSGRSRNDQVLTDIKLYFKDELISISKLILDLFDLLIELSEKYKSVYMPGYTHSQVAMPSSFGLWFAAYAESLVDDIFALEYAYRVVDQNPLGSAAGYGNSFPIDRELTTRELGFSQMSINVVSVQLSRGKAEKAVANAITSIGTTLNRLSSDIILFCNANHKFVSFPDELTTGSSIMPHKKNPDVWELIRAKSNIIEGSYGQISMLCRNLISGYHRDFQLYKEIIFPAIDSLKESISIANMMLTNISVNENILESDIYDYLYTVEEVNSLVLKGVPFRDAYKIVGKSVNDGTFRSNKKCTHTHVGSMGNLCNDRIILKMSEAIAWVKNQN